MVLAMRTLALLILTPVVSGTFPCPSGYASLTGAPACTGPMSSTCSLGTCCSLTGTLCSAHAVTGIAKCKQGSDTNMFFDLKKVALAYVGNTDDAFRATCCSSCSQATCADWLLPLVACDSGKMLSATTALASADCTLPTATSKKSTCCVAKATCADHPCSGLTKVSNAGSTYCPGNAATCSNALCCTGTLCSAYTLTGNTKCKTGSDTHMFFDLHKLQSPVADTTDPTIKSTCCSMCSQATCADWVLPLVSCDSGEMISSTTVLPSADCSPPSASLKKSTCCVAIPPAMKCAAYVAGEEASAAVHTALSFVCVWASFTLLVGAHLF